jgi:beta-alanine degradation protein BauB
MKAIATLVLIVFSLPLVASAHEGVHQEPVHFKVELENDSIVVLRIRLDPHEKTPMHEVSPRVVVWLTDSHLRDTFADGKTIELRRSAGTTEWIPAQEHSGENLSDTPIEFVAIVPKEKSRRAKNKSTSH